MTTSQPDEGVGPSEPQFGGSLQRTLLGWILILALLPLLLVSTLSYLQARRDLRAAAIHELEATENSKSDFLENWLDNRSMDLRMQSESRANSLLLEDLKRSWYESGKSLGDYVGSYAWAKIVDVPRQDLITVLRTYDFAHDLFLLDTEGNVLFSVLRKMDLGTNLFSGPYANTEFSKSAQAALETGAIRMSDLERYEPSGEVVVAFLSAPILDDWGDKVGVFAMQIRVNRIFGKLGEHSLGRESGRTYLVGEDGLLRTALRTGEDENVLRTEIQTDIVKNWIAQRRIEDIDGTGMAEIVAAASRYLGPFGRPVIGIQRPLHRLGVDWLMVSEVDEEEALASVDVLGMIMLVLSTLTALSIVGVAIVQARRITEPLLALTKFSKGAARGRLDRELVVQSKDEIGELVHAFNQMIVARRDQEEALLRSIQLSNEAERALASRVDDLALANEELDSFAYIASHDLKEPLRGIHNYSHFLMQDHGQDLNEEGRRLLSALPVLSQRLDNLLDALLRYARMGRKELNFTQVSVHEVVLYELDLLERNIKDAGVEVRLMDELPTLECDAAVAADVFRELIGNALKYNEKSDRWIEIGVRPSSEFEALARQPATPVFYVRDNGIGISEKHLRAIFRIFKRLHVRDRFGSGSGAGLTILEKLLTRCGGRIWVESVVDEGSTFFFTLAENHDE